MRKAFTVEEVNGLIPELEDVLGRIRSRGEELRQHHDQVKILDVLWGNRLMDPDTPDHGAFVRHQWEVRRLAAEIEWLVKEEITDRGIRFPQGGIEHGLLDFPTTWEGRWVYLCWRSGEPRVEAWHELDGGFAGRRALTNEQALRMGLHGG
jgi:hypothetical protein